MKLINITHSPARMRKIQKSQHATVAKLVLDVQVGFAVLSAKLF